MAGFGDGDDRRLDANREAEPLRFRKSEPRSAAAPALTLALPLLVAAIAGCSGGDAEPEVGVGGAELVLDADALAREAPPVVEERAADADPAIEAVIAHRGEIRFARFLGPAGEALWTASSRAVGLWNTADWTARPAPEFLDEGRGPTAADVAPDGRRWALSDIRFDPFQAAVRAGVWDPDADAASGSGNAPIHVAGKEIPALAFNPANPARLAVATEFDDESGATRVGLLLLKLDPGGFEPNIAGARLGFSAIPSAVRFSPDGSRLAAASARVGENFVTIGELLLWNGDDPEPVAIPNRVGAIADLVFTPDNAALVVAHVDAANQPRVSRLDPATLEPVSEVAAIAEKPTRLALDPAGNHLVVGLETGAIKIVRLADGAGVDLPDAHKGPVRSLAFSPDGARLATGGRDRRVVVWNVAELADRMNK